MIEIITNHYVIIILYIAGIISGWQLGKWHYYNGFIEWINRRVWSKKQ